MSDEEISKEISNYGKDEEISKYRKEFVKRMIGEEINDAYELFVQMKKEEDDTDAFNLLTFDEFFSLYREYSRLFSGTVMVEESLRETMRDEGVVSIDLDKLRSKKS